MTRRPRVAIVYDVLYPWVRGGAEKRYWEIARRLPGFGFEPHLIGPKYWDGPAAYRQDGVWLHGICPPVALYGPNGMRQIREAITFARALLPALLDIHVEVIDCCAFPYFPWFAARAVSALYRVPLLTTWPEYWGPYWRAYLGPRKGAAAQLVEIATAKLSSRHLCPSPLTEQRLAAVTAGRDIAVLPAGIDARALAPYAAPPAERHGIIYVGRLIAHKRVADLLHALAQLHATHPELSLTIIGSGPEQPALTMLARTLKLDTHVRFLANLDDSDLYRRVGSAQALILPSEREGQGMVVAEAQGVGTPPIVASGPETAASLFVKHGVSGLTYSVGDVQGLAHSIRAVLDEATCQRLQRGALEAAANLDWDTVIVPAMATLYTGMLSTSPAAPRTSDVIRPGLCHPTEVYRGG